MSDRVVWCERGYGSHGSPSLVNDVLIPLDLPLIEKRRDVRKGGEIGVR